jgi:hypothetical protein
MRLFALKLIALAIIAAIALAPLGVTGQELLKFAISPGSMYTYRPSPWTWIPGGEPSPGQLDFGVSGVLVFDPFVGSFRAADIALSGNESIQHDPPGYMPVTAPRVASFLESRSFGAAQFGPEYVELTADWPRGLLLRYYSNGDLTLTGGYDATPIDGDGMLFNVSATPLLPGDYNGDGSVDDLDFHVWNENFGTENLVADGNGDFYVDSADYVVWRKHASTGHGSAASVPEPSSAVLVMPGVFVLRRKMKASRVVRYGEH